MSPHNSNIIDKKYCNFFLLNSSAFDKNLILLQYRIQFIFYYSYRLKLMTKLYPQLHSTLNEDSSDMRHHMFLFRGDAPELPKPTALIAHRAQWLAAPPPWTHFGALIYGGVWSCFSAL